jgi:hypothetical protein
VLNVFAALGWAIASAWLLASLSTKAEVLVVSSVWDDQSNSGQQLS